MCEDFAPNVGHKKNWLLHHNDAPSHISFFTRKILTKNNTTVFPHPPYFPMFSRLKTKPKGRHFKTNEMIEAELRVVLNTLTEHDI
jgi:hypothetical protein